MSNMLKYEDFAENKNEDFFFEEEINRKNQFNNFVKKNEKNKKKAQSKALLTS